MHIMEFIENNKQNTGSKVIELMNGELREAVDLILEPYLLKDLVKIIEDYMCIVQISTSTVSGDPTCKIYKLNVKMDKSIKSPLHIVLHTKNNIDVLLNTSYNHNFIANEKYPEYICFNYNGLDDINCMFNKLFVDMFTGKYTTICYNTHRNGQRWDGHDNDGPLVCWNSCNEKSIISDVIHYRCYCFFKLEIKKWLNECPNNITTFITFLDRKDGHFRYDIKYIAGLTKKQLIILPYCMSI